MKKFKVGLVGIGGFGKTHLNVIRELENLGRVELVSACDKNLQANMENLIKQNYSNIKLYEDFDVFLDNESSVDFIAISTPIPLHKEMCCKAMEKGYNVLLEKPPAVTIQDIDQMIEIKRKTNKVCAVDFQRTSQKNFQEFKKILLSGAIGEIKRISGIGEARRDKVYYSRSPWVGKLVFDSKYVLDGTVNNPYSHLLNNCLIISKLMSNGSAQLVSVQGELYSANNIEGEDTSCLRADMGNGMEVYFFATTCCRINNGGNITVEGTKGNAYWDYDGYIKVWDEKGRLSEEHKMKSNANMDHYENLLEYLEGKTKYLSCSLEDSRDFVLASNLAFESSEQMHKIGREYVEYLNENGECIDSITSMEDSIHIKDIEGIMEKGAEEGKLFSEMGIDWSVKTKPVLSYGYKEFKLYK